MTRQTQWRFILGAVMALVLVIGVVIYYSRQADNTFDAMRLGQFGRAANFLQTSADAGSTQSQVLLANLYYAGLGVERDLKTAARWYETAAMKGNSAAQYNLGLFHMNGYGLPEDNVNAAAWFLLADASGSIHAETYLRLLSGSMNPNKIQVAEALKQKLERQISDE